MGPWQPKLGGSGLVWGPFPPSHAVAHGHGWLSTGELMDEDTLVLLAYPQPTLGQLQRLAHSPHRIAAHAPGQHTALSPCRPAHLLTAAGWDVCRLHFLSQGLKDGHLSKVLH